MIQKHCGVYIGVSALLFIFFISCTLIPVEKIWNVNGSVTFKGTPSQDVILAAFLIKRTDVFDIGCVCVSNVTHLGIEGGNFSLDMDVEEYTASSGDRIVLIFWEDSVRNRMYDDGERFEYTEPLPECPVFKKAVSCLFFYSDKQDDILLCAKGWNVDQGNLVSLSVSCAVLSNAKITNWYSWD